MLEPRSLFQVDLVISVILLDVTGNYSKKSAFGFRGVVRILTG